MGRRRGRRALRGDYVGLDARAALNADPRCTRLPKVTAGSRSRACADRHHCYRPATWEIDGRTYCIAHAATVQRFLPPRTEEDRTDDRL